MSPPPVFWDRLEPAQISTHIKKFLKFLWDVSCVQEMGTPDGRFTPWTFDSIYFDVKWCEDIDGSFRDSICLASVHVLLCSPASDSISHLIFSLHIHTQKMRILAVVIPKEKGFFLFNFQAASKLWRFLNWQSHIGIRIGISTQCTWVFVSWHDHFLSVTKLA